MEFKLDSWSMYYSHEYAGHMVVPEEKFLVDPVVGDYFVVGTERVLIEEVRSLNKFRVNPVDRFVLPYDKSYAPSGI